MESTQETRLQSQWKDQFQSFMASMEAKWQIIAKKAKTIQQLEFEASTPNTTQQALFQAYSAASQATDKGYSKETTMVQKHSSIRLDIPKFVGEDPQQWIFNIQEYFNFHQTPEMQRLQITGFCLEANASEWFHWMK